MCILVCAEGLVKLVHGKGVNVRKLGVLRSHLAEASPGARLILSEMVIRVIKNALRHVLRLHRDGMESNRTIFVSRTIIFCAHLAADGRMQGVVYFLNEVFGNSELRSCTCSNCFCLWSATRGCVTAPYSGGKRSRSSCGTSLITGHVMQSIVRS